MKRKARTRWPAHLTERLRRCREVMAKKRLDAYLTTNRMDQLYLTGFAGEDGGVLVTSRSAVLISDLRFAVAIAEETPWTTVVMRRKPLPIALAALITRRKLTRVGIDPDAWTVGLYEHVRKAIRPARLVAVEGMTTDLRMVKEPNEIAATRRAIDVAERAFQATLRSVRIGQTERDIAARLEYEMKRRGASGPSFDLIVAEGPNAAKPHAVPGTRKVRSGSVVLCDWGAVVDHYRSDLTRVFFVDRVPPPFRKMYGVVLEAQRRGIEAIRPGARMSAVDAAARRYIAEKGYGKAFGHSLGHGLGLDIHEQPNLARRSKGCLAEGMIVTVEPGVYLPGVGGVRIEDDVLVTGDGHEVLSGAPKTLEAMIIAGR